MNTIKKFTLDGVEFSVRYDDSLKAVIKVNKKVVFRGYLTTTRKGAIWQQYKSKVACALYPIFKAKNQYNAADKASDTAGRFSRVLACD